ncbi:MAG: long-chain-acyl-CoA synthetase [Chitinophagales bacterium]|nr:long-chain-acyl-CoA synthetase [Chitinophagales bacterium]MCZ2393324.1 long-chain-acyl-CoA synthetase [Chitinophagales bacterium]
MSIFNSDKDYKLSLFDFVPTIIKTLPQKIPHLILGGIPALIQKDSDEQSIGKVLETNAIKFKSRPAIYFENQVWTHRQFNEISNQYAHLFHHYGVKKGQVVAVFLENRPEVLFAVAALAKIGAIASLINSNQRSQILRHSIDQKNDGFYFIGNELREAFEEIRNSLTTSSGYQVCFGVADGKKYSFSDDYISVTKVLDKFPKSNFPGVQNILSGTPFAFIFTSGTTGMPKASIQVHRKWISCMYWFGKVNLGLEKEDVLYISIPFYHSNALLIGWSSAAISGAAMAIRRKFSVNEFWKDAIKFQATAFIYIGDICRYLYNAPASQYDTAHQVKKIVGNGLRPDIWKQFKERFGIEEVYEFYASSEGNMTFTNTLNLDNTVGWCATKFEIVEYDREQGEPVLDSKGYFKKVKWGDVGLMIFEISEKYPFPGYINKEDNYKKVFKNVFQKGDMWFNTGDIMRNIGFLHAQFVDREGDTFRWKGENVSTAEVEEVLNAYYSIDCCTVYGVNIPHSDGKAGMAAIKIKAGEKLDWEDFNHYLQSQLPSYAIPVFVRLVNHFEYTSTYKIVKNELKKEGFHQAKEVWLKKSKNSAYHQLTATELKKIEEEGI